MALRRKGKVVDPNITKRNELLMEKVASGLESRGMRAYCAPSKEDALSLALGMIPEGSSVGIGGCMSAREIGLYEVLENGSYTFEDHGPTQGIDWFISSANAITEDGVIVNIDGNGNRVSAIACGPRKVLFIVGMNKVCDDVDGAMKRARNVAAPINAQRFDLGTPCRKTGSCFDCKSPDSICCQFLITRFNRNVDRIHVILVNDDLGF